MKKVALLLLFLYAGMLFGQEVNRVRISPEAYFSVITCSAGEELYSSFGHSAFRFQDPIYGYDMVYNYGTFDFETPLFYVKFARGKLPYQLGRSSFKRFIYNYKEENRWVKAQVLDLTSEQVRQLFEYLENNYKEENRNYKYDFFFNNCATKKRDIIQENFGDAFIFHENHLTETKTFRDLIHENLDSNSWSSFGIDIALGAVIDKVAQPKEYQFLPEYVFKAFANATKQDGTPVVKETNLILEVPENVTTSKNILFSPYVVFSIVMLIILVITFLDYKNNERSRWLDFTILLVNGIAGIIIFLLWFATDHTATYTNMNALWLFAPNLWFAFKFLSKNEQSSLWIYATVLLALLVVLLFIWFLKFEVFAFAAIPLLIALAVRYVYLVYYFRRLKTEV